VGEALLDFQGVDPTKMHLGRQYRAIRGIQTRGPSPCGSSRRRLTFNRFVPGRSRIGCLTARLS